MKKVEHSINWAPADKIIIETTLISSNKIEGTYHIAQLAKAPKYKWYIVKPATGKTEVTISNDKKEK